MLSSLSLLDLSKELSIQASIARDIINETLIIVSKEINEKSRNNSFVLLSPLPVPQTPVSPSSPFTATATDTSIDSTDMTHSSVESVDKILYQEQKVLGVKKKVLSIVNKKVSVNVSSMKMSSSLILL